MSHTRFALGFTRNRKVFRLSDAAFRLWVSAIDYAREQKTDGEVAESEIDAIPRLPGYEREMRQAVIQELVAAGLWERVAEGWRIHDFLHWQDSSEQIAAKQERARERMRSVRANIERSSEKVRTKFDQHASLSSSLSSGSGEGVQGENQPEQAKKAPEKRKNQVAFPADFEQEIRPKVDAWASEKGYPSWWVSERLEAMKQACLSKNLRFADWYLAAIGWLRRDDQDYGNGPAALETRRARNGGKPPGMADHEQHLADEARRKARQMLPRRAQ